MKTVEDNIYWFESAAKEKGKEEGKREDQITSVANLLRHNRDPETAAIASGLPESCIQQIQAMVAEGMSNEDIIARLMAPAEAV